MKSTVYDLSFTFQQKNGHYLVIDEKKGEQLTDSALIPLQVRMMQSNQIPNLLPLSIEEMDFNIKLYYDITSKRTLSTFLKSHSLTSFEFYQLLISLLTTLEQSKLYMLNEHQYVLNEDFIYLGKEPQQLFLTYVPIQAVEKTDSSLEEIKQLIISVSDRIEGFQGSERKHLLQYLKDPSFSFKGLKELLLDLQQLRPDPYGSYQAPFQQGYQQTAAQGGQFSEQQPSAAVQPADESAPAKAEIKKASSEKKNKKQKKAKKGNEEEKKNPVLYIILFEILLLAAIWKVFEMFPNQIMLITSAVLSVISLAAAVFMMVKGKRKAEEAEEETEEKPVQQGQVLNMNQMQNPAFSMQAASGETQQQPYKKKIYYGEPPKRQETPAQMPVQKAVVTAPPAEQEIPSVKTSAAGMNQSYSSAAPVQAIREFSVDTSLLAEGDDTVLLEEEKEEIHDSSVTSYPVLEADRNGDIESISIETDHFTIGRSAESAEYVEDSVGISRVHIELIRIEDSYGLKDLGSKNGTKLNGENIVPYKIYALNTGDIISIGRIDYHFKWE